MNVWLAVVAIVAIVMCAETVQKIAKARAEKKAGREDLAELLARMDALEERVRVLERIVTENKHDLRQEISRL